MKANVPRTDRGSATLGISVAEIFLRKRSSTRITRKTVRTKVNCTSFTEALMVSVRSEKIAMCIPEGSEAVSFGSSAFTRSTVSIILAPGCL